MNPDYRRVPPESVKDAYTQNNMVDFVLPVPKGKRVVRNSITINGTCAFNAFDPANANTDQFYDASIGFHGLFNSFMFGREFGSKKTLRNYPRYVKMTRKAKTIQQFASSTYANELAFTDDSLTKFIMRGRGDNTVQFSIKPLIGYNMIMNNQNITSKQGHIYLSFRLARHQDFFYGTDYANATYSLSDLMVSYLVEDDAGSNGPIEYTTFDYFPHLIESNYANFSSVVPDNCFAIAATVQDHANVGDSANFSQLDFDELPGLSEINFQVNDTNGAIKFRLDNSEEIFMNFLSCFKPQMDVNSIQYKDETMIGFNYQVPIPGQKIGISILSEPAGASYDLHLYSLVVAAEEQ